MSATGPGAGTRRGRFAREVKHDGSPVVTRTPQFGPPQRRTPSRLVSTTLVVLRVYVIVMTTLVVLTLIIALRGGGR